MEVLLPVGRRPELLAGPPMRSERVVGRTLLGVAQHLVRFAELFEALFGIRLLADVRMVFAGEAAVRALDLLLRRVSLDAHDLVVVLVLHPALPRAREPDTGTTSAGWILYGTVGARRAGIKPMRARSPKCWDTMAARCWTAPTDFCSGDWPWRHWPRCSLGAPRRRHLATASKARIRHSCCARPAFTSGRTSTSARSTWSRATTICSFSPA